MEENRTAVSNQANPLEDLAPYGLAYVIWELVNEERESRGRNALDMNDELMENAMVRAEAVSYTHLKRNQPDRGGHGKTGPGPWGGAAGE